jgi:hypothetical protein
VEGVITALNCERLKAVKAVVKNVVQEEGRAQGKEVCD